MKYSFLSSSSVAHVSAVMPHPGVVVGAVVAALLTAVIITVVVVLLVILCRRFEYMKYLYSK